MYMYNSSACVKLHNVHNSPNLGLKVNVWSVINNDLSHLGGYICQSSFGIVAGTCPCIKFVNAGDLE